MIGAQVMARISTVSLFSSLVLLMAISASTAVFAAGTFEQRRDCRDDAMKFCGKFVPDVKLITQCMEKNVAKLSPLCRKQFRHDHPS
jgi:hypothetical protein